MGAGAAVVADDVDAFARAGRSVPRDMVERGSHDRVALFQRRAAGAEYVVGESGDAVAGAHAAEVVGLLGKPRPGEVGTGRSLEPFDDRAHLVVFIRAGRDDRGRSLRPQGGV